MQKYTNQELLEVLPPSISETKELTKKQKVVLGQLYIYNGLDAAKKDGFFYRSNKDLATDCDIEERTIITAIRRLETLGFIERKVGSRTKGASLYRVNEKAMNNYCKTPIEDYSNDYSKQITAMADKIKHLENTVKMLIEKITVIEGRNYSTDTESDIDIDKEKDLEKDNNIINNKNRDFEKTDNNKELEQIDEFENSEKEKNFKLEESEEKKGQSQLELAEAEASTPIEQSQETSTSKELEDEEYSRQLENYIPTVEECKQIQLFLDYLKPLFKEYLTAKTIKDLEAIHSTTLQAVNDYVNVHSISDAQIWRVAGVIAENKAHQKDVIEKFQKTKLLKYQAKQLSLA